MLLLYSIYFIFYLPGTYYKILNIFYAGAFTSLIYDFLNKLSRIDFSFTVGITKTYTQ